MVRGGRQKGEFHSAGPITGPIAPVDLELFQDKGVGLTR